MQGKEDFLISFFFLSRIDTSGPTRSKYSLFVFYGPLAEAEGPTFWSRIQRRARGAAGMLTRQLPGLPRDDRQKLGCLSVCPCKSRSVTLSKLTWKGIGPHVTETSGIDLKYLPNLGNSGAVMAMCEHRGMAACSFFDSLGLRE